MKKLKVLLMIDWAPEKRSYLAEELIKLGIDCDVIGTDFSVAKWKPIKKYFTHWYRCFIVSYKAFKKRHKYDYIISWQQLMGLFYAGLKQFVKNDRPRLFITKTILSERKNPVIAFIRKVGFRKMLKGADIIGCCTLPLLRKMRDEYTLPESKLVHLPFFYQAKEDFTEEEIQKTDMEIFSIGVSNRDYLTLLRAAERINHKFVIVAPKFTLSGLSIPSNVKIYNNLFGIEASRLMRRARMVVIPLKSVNFPSGETVLFEAMTYGKPVIITRSITTQEYVKHEVDGLLVEKQNEDELVQAINYFLEDSKRAKKIGTAGRISLKRSYTIENFSENIYNYLYSDYKKGKMN
ncbi:MAG: glycosyltransferase family 4 protein [bacterium]